MSEGREKGGGCGFWRQGREKEAAGSKKAVIKKITAGVKGGARENKAKTKSGGGESRNKTPAHPEHHRF